MTACDEIETKCLRIVFAEFGGKQAVLYSSLSLAHNVKAIWLNNHTDLG